MEEKNLTQQLQELIPQYVENKAELESYKAICEKENAQIKDLMKQIGESAYTSGNYTVKFIVQRRETMNEEKVIDIIRKYGIPDIIKTKPYIDYDALESAIYLDKVPDAAVAEMNAAKEVKLVETLKISGRKSSK